MIDRNRFLFAVTVITFSIAMSAGCRSHFGSGVQPVQPAQNPVANATTHTNADRAAGTHEMSELLKSIAASIDPRDTTLVVNRERAALMKAAIQSASDDYPGASLRLQYAIELVRAGDNSEALKQLDQLEAQLKRLSASLWKSNSRTVLIWKAIANMRIGELQNCCSVANADSCLIPIQNGGIHTRTEGSTSAIRYFEMILQDHPDDMEARWLLNVACMTLGKYPNAVPSKWLIPPSAFKSEADCGKFKNVAPRIGLKLLGLSGGAVVEDFDGDGLLDLMVSGMGFEDQLHFYHNNGDGTFTDRTKEAGLIGETGGLNLFQADYNNDGFPDLLVLRGGWLGKAGNFPFSLLRNNGDGTFSDVTRAAGLLHRAATQSAVWLDYNNDGKLDLFVGYESGAAGTHPCSLFRNNGDGTFTDVAQQAGVDAVGWVKSAVSVDYDNDGWPDIFLSVFGGKKVLYHNNGNGTFTDVADKAGIKGPKFSFGSFFFDYDNDGWPDLFVCGYKSDSIGDITGEYIGKPGTSVERPALYHNNRDGTFTEVTREAHLYHSIAGMGLNFGDIDNDGLLDIYIGTGNPDFAALVPNRMFRNKDGKTFQDVTTSTDTGHLQKGHAVVFADFNNDGQQDVFAQMGGAYHSDVAFSALFANPGHRNHWITLKLEGVQSNRSAFGARIDVAATTRRGIRHLFRTVGTGGSFGGNPLRQEIGLGDAVSIDHVDIFWPVTRKTQHIDGKTLLMDRFWHIREDQTSPDQLHLKSFRWPN